MFAKHTVHCIIYRTYIIEENDNFSYWFVLHVYIYSAVYYSWEGEVRFFHALGPAGPFAKRHEQQQFQHTEKTS